MELAEDARCAVHPDVAARAACGRCGDFVCEACQSPVDEWGTTCLACVRRKAREGYRSASGLARVLRGLFVAIVVLVGLTAIAELFQIELLGRIATGEFTEDEAADNDLRLALLGGGYVLAFLATAVVFCVWMNRTSRNASALGATLAFGPHAWGWFFCPLLNLWKPYQAVRELSDVSSAGAPRPSVLAAWWALWVIGNFASRIESTLFETTDISALITATWFSLFTLTATAGAAVSALVVVRSIDRAQQARARELFETGPPA